MYIISYDISDNNARRKVSELLKDYGVRIQYSVFESELTKEEADKLMKIIANKINTKKDSVKFYYLCSKCSSKSKELGVKKVEEFAELYTL